MSDPNSTLWQPPLTREQASGMPPADGVVKQLPGIGEIADKVSQSPNYQALKPPVQQIAPNGSPIVDKILAGISSFNDAFMNKNPSARLAKAIFPKLMSHVTQADSAAESLKQQNPNAAKVGDFAGNIASIVQPSPPAGGTLGSMAMNAATTMAPYSAIAGADAYNKTGDIGEAAKRALASEALGVGVGTALGGAGLLFGKLAKSAHPILNEIDAASYGLAGQDIAKPGAEYARKMGLNPIGYKANTGDAQLDKVMTLLREEGGRGKAGIEKATNWINEQYDKVNSVFKESGAQVASKVPDILSSPIVQTMKSKFAPEEVDSTIQSLVGEVDKRIAAGPKGWTDAIGFLNKQMQRGIQIGQKAEGGSLEEVTRLANMGEILQDSASVVKAHMKELTTHVLSEAKEMGQTVPDLEAVDSIYSAYPSLQRNLSRRAGKPMSSMAGGSETTAGLGTLAGIAGAVGGPAAAGIAKAAGATALAPLIKRGIGAATNQVMGRSAAWIDKLLQGLAKTKGINPVLAARVVGNRELGGSNANIMDLISGPRMPEEQPQDVSAPQDTVKPVPIPPATGQPGPEASQPIQNAPSQPPAPSPIDLQNKANSDFIGDTQNASGHAFAPKLLEQRLQMMYELHQRRLQGFAEPYEQFVQAVKQGTDNFNPDNPATWQGLVDDPAQAEKLYKAHMAMKKLDGPKVISNALNHYTDNLVNSGIGGAGRLSSSERMAHDADNEKLISALKGMGVGDTKEIDTRLKQIMWDKNKNPEQKKQAVIDMIVNEGGVDLPKLMQMGLWK